jgi:hypothetical protein
MSKPSRNAGSDQRKLESIRAAALLPQGRRPFVASALVSAGFAACGDLHLTNPIGVGFACTWAQAHVRYVGPAL